MNMNWKKIFDSYVIKNFSIRIIFYPYMLVKKKHTKTSEKKYSGKVMFKYFTVEKYSQKIKCFQLYY